LNRTDENGDLEQGRDPHVSTFDLTHDPKPTVVRRLEVITGVGGRRKWSADAKAEIML
jgi:transposase